MLQLGEEFRLLRHILNTGSNITVPVFWLQLFVRDTLQAEGTSLLSLKKKLRGLLALCIFALQVTLNVLVHDIIYRAGVWRVGSVCHHVIALGDVVAVNITVCIVVCICCVFSLIAAVAE